MLKPGLLLSSLLIVARGGAAIDFSIGSRIVNGNTVNDGEIPYQVSLQRRRGHFCGASILNENYVITAAHCVQYLAAYGVRVVVGTTDLNQPEIVHIGLSIYVHENYQPLKAYENDIALVKVKTPFKFSRTVSPVKLPKANDDVADGKIAVVSGWGDLHQNGPAPRYLQKVNVQIANQEYCRDVYSKQNYSIHATQICAHDPIVEHGVCQGDSGGPLTINRTLIGISSWASGCGHVNYPGVYTRVSKYIDWIQQHAT